MRPSTAPQQNLPPLAPLALIPLPLGAVKPTGWLRNQLEIQAKGQSGTLPTWWESLLESKTAWLGGDGEGWERGPYYMDGLVPLAHLLEDPLLIERSNRWIDWSVQSQREDGSFGPPGLDDWWPYAPVLKALAQHQEATGDPRVVPMMQRFFYHMSANIDQRRPFSWAIYRWMELVLPLMWCYNRTEDESLLRLAGKLWAYGYDWTRHFEDFVLTQKQAHRFPLSSHVVNNAMGVKSPAVVFEMSRWVEHRDSAKKAVQFLDQFHGTAAGVFTGDEHLAGKEPTQGTEVCAVVEYMYSLERIAAVTGESWVGDKLEQVAFNALPATFDGRMTLHQYDQQVNQVLCSRAKRDWTNNGDDSNLFGIEPNFGCCTANFHQGWPKLVAHLWSATIDGGLACLVYSPCRVETELAGGPVQVEVETEYPFEATIRVRVTSDRPQRFDLQLRVPAWCAGMTVDGKEVPAGSGWFHVDREWNGTTEIVVVLPMAVRLEERLRGAVAVHRGPLLYAVRVGEEWRPIDAESEHPDYEVLPTTSWNVAIEADAEKLEQSLTRKPLGNVLFESEFAPLQMTARAKVVTAWGMHNHSAGPTPESPLVSDEPWTEVELVPYGCAKLRVGEIPVLDPSN